MCLRSRRVAPQGQDHRRASNHVGGIDEREERKEVIKSVEDQDIQDEGCQQHTWMNVVGIDEGEVEDKKARKQDEREKERERREQDDQRDDHHSPLEPQDYLKYRVYVLLQYFRHCIPQYSKWYTSLEILLILGQLVGVVLGFLGKGSWTGIVASTAAAITAWSVARGFQKKRERTASAVETLDSLLQWWNFLQLFDRCNVENVNRLVNMCEAVFERQRDSWVSTAVTANMEIQVLLQNTGQGRARERD